MVFAIETLFSKIGMQAVPTPLKVTVVASLFVLPIVFMCYVLCCMKDDVVEPEAPNRKPGSNKNREKIE